MSGANSGSSTATPATKFGRISFRPRPIDVSKPLQIIRTEIEDDDSSRAVPMMPTGMESNEESELHLQEIIHASSNRRANDELLEIPIPVIKIVDGYDEAPNSHPYYFGTTYALFSLRNDEELDQTVEYDADSEDERFAKEQVPALSTDKFEFAIDKLEKEHYYHGACELGRAEQLLRGIKPGVVANIHRYWTEKRRNKSTLVRRLLRAPDRDDPSPYKSFRPREPETNKQKKGRKNDTASLNKMSALRQEMERSRTLLEMIKKRERLKSDRARVVEKLMDKLRELAEIRILEPDTEPEPEHVATPKKRAREEGVAAGTNERGEAPVCGGPGFGAHDQTLILGNGKARQEGYRHFIVNPGQFPTPSLERQYGGDAFQASPLIKSDSQSFFPTSPSQEITSIITGDSTDASSTTDNEHLQTTDNKKKEADRLEEQKRLIADKYFNNIPVPTSADYYSDIDAAGDSNHSTDDDSDSDEIRRRRLRQSGGKRAPTISSLQSTYYKTPQYTNLQPQKRPDGTPIYPSFNQGYLFIGPNIPPVLGCVRVGRYGGTYIDYVPLDKESKIHFIQHLRDQKIKLQQQKSSLNNQNQNNNSNNNNSNNNNDILKMEDDQQTPQISIDQTISSSIHQSPPTVSTSPSLTTATTIFSTSSPTLSHSSPSQSTQSAITSSGDPSNGQDESSNSMDIDNNNNNNNNNNHFSNSIYSTSIPQSSSNKNHFTKITDYQNIITKTTSSTSIPQSSSTNNFINQSPVRSSNGGSVSHNNNNNGINNSSNNDPNNINHNNNNGNGGLTPSHKKLKSSSSSSTTISGPSTSTPYSPSTKVKKQSNTVSSPTSTSNPIDQYFIKKKASTTSM